MVFLILVAQRTEGANLFSRIGPPSNTDKEAAAARTNHHVPPACGIYYYEVEVLNPGVRG
jgi:Ran-binding protein 9/10